jgi:Ca2+-binding EF-hand superfamily protein
MNKYHFTALILGSSLVVAGSAFAGADCDKAEGRAEHGPGARFSQMDTNKDNKLNLAELTASREGWLTQVDANKDGVASQAEIEQSFTKARQERVAKMFERQDANKDGRVTREESHMPSAWFERADANKDGALTVAELTSARKNAGPSNTGKPGVQTGKLSRLDENGDGKVEIAEIRNAASRQFARLDKNSDGAVTNDEFRSSRGHHGKHRGGAETPPVAPKTTPAPTAS